MSFYSPIRCYTCGKVTCTKIASYHRLRSEGKESKQALDELGLRRPCCRRMIITDIDIPIEMNRQDKNDHGGVINQISTLVDSSLEQKDFNKQDFVFVKPEARISQKKRKVIEI